MVHLEPVSEENVWKICNLQVAEDQRSFVAANKDSIVEAYVTVSSGGVALPFGIYDDAVPIGFLMIGYTDVEEGEIKGVLGNAYCIWRFMIDERFQGRGYGRQAFQLALDYIRTFPKGSSEYIYLSYEPENKGAAALYRSFGFEETGDHDEDELIAVRRIERSDF